MNSDASKRFLDLVTKPLAANLELSALARGAISSKLKPEFVDELEEASKRLEKSDCSKWKPTWVGLGLILFGIALLGVSASMWLPKWHVATYMLGFNQYISWPEAISETQGLLASGLPVKDQMLIKNEFDKLQDLYPSDPLNFAPRFQYELGVAQNTTGKVPLALLDRVSKIDPDNGWWPYIAANVISKRLDLIDTPVSGNLLRWEPGEQEKVDLSLGLFRQAAAAPRFDSYQTAIKSRKIALSPPAETVQDCATNLLYIHSFYMGLGEELSFLDGLVATQAQKRADLKDIPGFKILLNDWIQLANAKASDFNQMDDLHLRTSSLRVTLPPLLAAARQLKLDQETKALEESIAILDRQNHRFPTNKANQQAFRFHGSHLTSLASTAGGDCGLAGDYFQGRYPPMTMERLKPNRRSEHAYVAQLMILPLGFLLTATSACLFIFGFRNGKLCRELSGRFAGIFDHSDWLHCVAFGVMLPMLYFSVIRYFTPFGGLDWFEGSHGHDLERTRFLLLFLLIVSCSLLVLRRRLSVRMNFFQSNDRKGRIGLILTIAGFVSLPLLGCCVQTERDQFVSLNMVMIYPTLLVMGLLLIWLIALTIRCLLGNPEQALRRHILSRVMARTMIWAFALVCASLPLHRIEETFWMKRDTAMRADPQHPAVTRYEWEVIQQMKSELFEILAPLKIVSR